MQVRSCGDQKCYGDDVLLGCLCAVNLGGFLGTFLDSGQVPVGRQSLNVTFSIVIWKPGHSRKLVVDCNAIRVSIYLHTLEGEYYYFHSHPTLIIQF